MAPGDVVVWLPEPFDRGLGTVIGIVEIGWLEVYWHDGELGIYGPSQIELADTWEHQQVEQALA